MTDSHLGDDAEIYALGALDPAERAAVEAHVTTCGDCAARVAAAEAVAASLAAALPSYEPPARLDARIAALGKRPWRATTTWTRLAAVAAIVVLAFVAWHDFVDRSQRDAADMAMATILHSHFEHTMMVPAAAGVPAAKVLFARDGAWIYVIADRPAAGARVILEGGAAPADAGALVAQGPVAVLMVPSARRPASVTLQRDGRTLDAATLHYPAR